MGNPALKAPSQCQESSEREGALGCKARRVWPIAMGLTLPPFFSRVISEASKKVEPTAEGVLPLTTRLDGKHSEELPASPFCWSTDQVSQMLEVKAIRATSRAIGE